MYGDMTGFQMKEFKWPFVENVYPFHVKKINNKIYVSAYHPYPDQINQYDGYLLVVNPDSGELEVIYSAYHINELLTFEEHKDGIRIIGLRYENDEYDEEWEELITEDGEVIEP